MTDAAVVKLHSNAEIAERLGDILNPKPEPSTHDKLDALLQAGIADKHRADVSALVIRYMLLAAIDSTSKIQIALIAMRQPHTAAFDSELTQLYNYSAALMNTIREAKGLLPVKAPELPNG